MKKILNPAQDLFEKFCAFYAQRDIQAILNLCSSRCTLWGTGLDEYREGPKGMEEQLKRDWIQSSQGSIRIVSFLPTPPATLWIAALCEAHIMIEGKEHIFKDLRGTLTAIQEKGEWKIAHMHASFPDYRNPDAHSFPIQSS